MTMDSVFNCTFGIDPNLQKNPGNIFLVKTRSFMNSISDLNPFIYFLSIIFFVKLVYQKHKKYFLNKLF